jgi:hypothetical protein
VTPWSWALAKAPALAQEGLRLQRDLVLAHMSKTIGIPESTLRAEFSRLRRFAGRSAAGTEVGANLPGAASRGARWAAEHDLLTALVCRPSRLEEAVAEWPSDRVRDPGFRRLYEALLANRTRRDGDIESVVLRLEDETLAGLAVQLHERGEALEACRPENETGAGPLDRTFDDALRALRGLEEEEDLAARSRAVKDARAGDDEALRAFGKARTERQGFVPPGERRREPPES